MWQILDARKPPSNSPRLPRISPHIYHQRTTFCARFFANPPAKTHLYLRFKKIRQDSSLRKTNQLVEGVGSVGVVGDSEACGVSAVAAWVADASASDA